MKNEHSLPSKGTEVECILPKDASDKLFAGEAESHLVAPSRSRKWDKFNPSRKYWVYRGDEGKTTLSLTNFVFVLYKDITEGQTTTRVRLQYDVESHIAGAWLPVKVNFYQSQGGLL
jgi:hypothetical protein